MIPIACTLTSAEYRSRTGAMAELAGRALVDRRPVPGGERLTFAAGADVREAVEAFAAAEARCCPFLRFDVAPAGDRVEVTVTGPAEAAPIIAALFA